MLRIFSLIFVLVFSSSVSWGSGFVRPRELSVEQNRLAQMGNRLLFARVLGMQPVPAHWDQFIQEWLSLPFLTQIELINTLVVGGDAGKNYQDEIRDDLGLPLVRGGAEPLSLTWNQLLEGVWEGAGKYSRSTRPVMRTQFSIMVQTLKIHELMGYLLANPEHSEAAKIIVHKVMTGESPESAFHDVFPAHAVDAGKLKFSHDQGEEYDPGILRYAFAPFSIPFSMTTKFAYEQMTFLQNSRFFSQTQKAGIYQTFEKKLKLHDRPTLIMANLNLRQVLKGISVFGVAGGNFENLQSFEQNIMAQFSQKFQNYWPLSTPLPKNFMEFFFQDGGVPEQDLQDMHIKGAIQNFFASDPYKLQNQGWHDFLLDFIRRLYENHGLLYSVETVPVGQRGELWTFDRAIRDAIGGARITYKDRLPQGRFEDLIIQLITGRRDPEAIYADARKSAIINTMPLLAAEDRDEIIKVLFHDPDFMNIPQDAPEHVEPNYRNILLKILQDRGVLADDHDEVLKLVLNHGKSIGDALDEVGVVNQEVLEENIIVDKGLVKLSNVWSPLDAAQKQNVRVRIRKNNEFFPFTKDFAESDDPSGNKARFIYSMIQGLTDQDNQLISPQEIVQAVDLSIFYHEALVPRFINFCGLVSFDENAAETTYNGSELFDCIGRAAPHRVQALENVAKRFRRSLEKDILETTGRHIFLPPIRTVMSWNQAIDDALVDGQYTILGRLRESVKTVSFRHTQEVLRVFDMGEDHADFDARIMLPWSIGPWAQYKTIDDLVGHNPKDFQMQALCMQIYNIIKLDENDPQRFIDMWESVLDADDEVAKKVPVTLLEAPGIETLEGKRLRNGRLEELLYRLFGFGFEDLDVLVPLNHKFHPKRSENFHSTKFIDNLPLDWQRRHYRKKLFSGLTREDGDLDPDRLLVAFPVLMVGAANCLDGLSRAVTSITQFQTISIDSEPQEIFMNNLCAQLVSKATGLASASGGHESAVNIQFIDAILQKLLGFSTPTLRKEDFAYMGTTPYVKGLRADDPNVIIRSGFDMLFTDMLTFFSENLKISDLIKIVQDRSDFKPYEEGGEVKIYKNHWQVWARSYPPTANMELSELFNVEPDDDGLRHPKQEVALHFLASMGLVCAEIPTELLGRPFSPFKIRLGKGIFHGDDVPYKFTITEGDHYRLAAEDGNALYPSFGADINWDAVTALGLQKRARFLEIAVDVEEYPEPQGRQNAQPLPAALVFGQPQPVVVPALPNLDLIAQNALVARANVAQDNQDREQARGQLGMYVDQGEQWAVAAFGALNW